MRSFLLAAVLCVIVLPGTAMAVDGAAIFLKKCAACHGLEGEGRPGVAPAFKGNGFIIGSDDAAIAKVIKNGRRGEERRKNTRISSIP